jgi:iron(III) transport system ATP-binding protein
MSDQLVVDNLSLRFARHTVLQQVSFRLANGRIGCLLGPSGCGKTTLLRAIAGFEPIVSGTVSLAGEVVSSPGKLVLPERRRIGMVFQDFALFPHLSVADNISFGLRGMSSEERRQRVTELLHLVNLDGYQKRYPHQLSGGQQQRVALSRALAPKPRLLLLDEPFASQDVELREALAQEVRSILIKEQMTAILVTHDQNEAFAMADEIGVMQNGSLLQWDTAYNLYHRPVSLFVADFIGQGVLLPGVVKAMRLVETDLGVIEGAVPEHCGTGQTVGVLIRPDDVELSPHGTHAARVKTRIFRGAQYLYGLQCESGQEVLCLAPSHTILEPGEPTRFNLALEHRVILPSDTAGIFSKESV